MKYVLKWSKDKDGYTFNSIDHYTLMDLNTAFKRIEYYIVAHPKREIIVVESANENQ